MKIEVINSDNLNLWDFADMAAEDIDTIDVPDWISCEDTISLGEIAGILTGGCAGQAYMPACTYATANDTMHEHGDDVLQYIEDAMGELPAPEGESWQGMAVFYLSTAIELWAASVEEELEDAIADIVDSERQMIANQWPDILALVVEQYGEDDMPAINEAFNNWTDGLCKDGIISDYTYDNVILLEG